MMKACLPPLAADSLYKEELVVKIRYLLHTMQSFSSISMIFKRDLLERLTHATTVYYWWWSYVREVGHLMSHSNTIKTRTGNIFVMAVMTPLIIFVEQLGAGLWFTAGGQHIPFGSSPQDVWSELGRPCSIHDKQVDQMVIHSAPNPKPRTTLCGDYLYNYFTCGLDILFNGQSYKIKKFVLHTNYPGHADFNSYTKCNFVIHTSDYDSLPQDANTSKSTVTLNSNWEQVKEILGDSGRAVIQTRGSTANPFGSTFVYGYPNIAFEVMKNGYIAAATLFQC